MAPVLCMETLERGIMAPVLCMETLEREGPYIKGFQVSAPYVAIFLCVD